MILNIECFFINKSSGEQIAKEMFIYESVGGIYENKFYQKKMSKTIAKQINTYLLDSIKFISQNFGTDKLYFSSNLYFGNYVGIGQKLTYIHKYRYSLSIGVSLYGRKSKQVPEPDEYGLEAALLLFAFPFSLFIHYENLTNYEVLVGRVYPLDRKGIYSLNLTGGLLIQRCTSLLNNKEIIP